MSGEDIWAQEDEDEFELIEEIEAKEIITVEEYGFLRKYYDNFYQGIAEKEFTINGQKYFAEVDGFDDGNFPDSANTRICIVKEVRK